MINTDLVLVTNIVYIILIEKYYDHYTLIKNNIVLINFADRTVMKFSTERRSNPITYCRVMNIVQQLYFYVTNVRSGN